MNRLEISRKDLKYNIDKIFEKLNEYGKLDDKSNTQIIGVVKINAYGLGLVPFSKILLKNGVNFLAVATPEEAFELRANGINCKILLMTPVIEKPDLIELIKKDIILTVGSNYELEQIDRVYDELNVKKVNVHIKIDTGFSRYGFLYDELEVIEDIFSNNKIQIQGMYTHFSKSLDEGWTNVQFDRFISVVEYLKRNGFDPGLLHCCNSVAFFKYPNMHLNAVRIGSAWLGRLPEDLGGLKKIGTLKSRVLEIRTVPSGTSVSYTNKFITKRQTTLATIPLGYMNGLNVSRERDTFSVGDNFRAGCREFKNLFNTKRLKVNINGKDCSIVGRLGTLHAIIDVTDIDCKVGDFVTLYVNPVYVDEKIKREYV